MDQVIALALRSSFRLCASLFRGPDKQIDEVLPATVEERRHSSVVQVFQPAAKERKFLTGQVFDRRCEIQLAVRTRASRYADPQRSHRSDDFPTAASGRDRKLSQSQKLIA